MKTATSIAILSGLLVLCVELCLASGTDQAHCGTCPPSPACFAKSRVVCQSDAECAADEKCCDVNCVVQCTKVNSVKPGACPMVKCATGNLVQNQCNCDSDCDGIQKCCTMCSGRQCK
ncbi:WAP four-disulfide core domain protein 5-like [Rhinatrema bivittatum]|uniref:WAP four-disulfide core domain protein 5-like n=1 Tax=Rhinatrema bivittatum TaxID=194408 RepID=UPI00112B9A42|nr:WAP four-disulfide core domain protein 5-like [Rhinatrema bivittatum]